MPKTLTPSQAAALKELPRVTMFASTFMLYYELVRLGYVEVHESKEHGNSADITPLGLAALREYESKEGK